MQAFARSRRHHSRHCYRGASLIVYRTMIRAFASIPALAGLLASAASTAHAQAARSEAAVIAVPAVIKGADVTRTARQYLGVPYLFGGTTPKAFDCSGFVRYVYGRHGIALPRTAREQATVGDAPLPGDLQAGDLLFFYGGRGAQHVAMYVGSDSIIHAASRGGRVKLDHLSTRRKQQTWYGQRLIAVRRLLPAEGTLYFPTPAAVPWFSHQAPVLFTSPAPGPRALMY
jgi:cell wall-associated NlpC family hydrolase